MPRNTKMRERYRIFVFLGIGTKRKADEIMNMLEELKALGVDVDKALGVLNGKESLYEKLIFKFHDMVQESNVTQDNMEDIYERIHALKGASGNLGITPLYDRYVEILEKIRADQINEVPALVSALLPVQQQIVDCIKGFM